MITITYGTAFSVYLSGGSTKETRLAGILRESHGQWMALPLGKTDWKGGFTDRSEAAEYLTAG